MDQPRRVPVEVPTIIAFALVPADSSDSTFGGARAVAEHFGFDDQADRTLSIPLSRSTPAVAGALLTLASHLSAQIPTGIARAAWLAGCWEAASPRRTIEEQWMVPRAVPGSIA